MKQDILDTLFSDILEAKPTISKDKTDDKDKAAAPVLATTKDDLWSIKEIPKSHKILKIEPINPNIVYDDLPVDDVLEQQADKDALVKLLEPSNIMIEKILKYIEKAEIANEPKDKITTYTGTAAFIHGDKKYLLGKEDAQVIYANILQMHELSTLQKVVSKKPNTLKNLLIDIPANKFHFENPFLLGMDHTMILKLTQKSLSLSLNNVLEKNPDSDLCINTSSLANNLGRTLCESYIHDHYIYEKLNAAECQEQLKRERLFNEKIQIKGYRKRTLKELQETINKFHTIGFSENTLEQQKFLQTKNYTLPHISKVFAVLAYLKKTILISAIHNEADGLDKNNLPESPQLKENRKTLRDYETELNVVYTTVGLEIVNSLINLGIIEETLSSGKHKNVPAIKLSLEYESFLYVPSSSYKPPISMGEFSTEYTFRKDFIDYTVDINKEPVPNKRDTHIKSTPELLEAIHNASTMPFCIDEQMFIEFLELIKKVAELNANDPRRIDYISTFYDLNFSAYIEQYKKESQNNTSDQNIAIEELIKYALRINQYDYNKYDPKIKNHISLDAAYKKIRSYKFHFRGILNDLNLYKHFEYFYIPKYVTSTGRMQSAPFYLQLQGHKILLAFIQCFVQNKPELNEDQYDTLNGIIKEQYPHVTLPENVESYNQEAKNLYIQQVKELCKPGTEISEYRKHQQDVVTEFAWLYKHSKKLESVFLLKSLILALENNTHYKKIIKKDATGSGPQIISMLTEDEELMGYTNISGENYNDLYKKMIDEYLSNMEKQELTLNEFCKVVFNITYEEFKQGKGIPQGKENVIYRLLHLRKKTKKEFYAEFDALYNKNSHYFKDKQELIEKVIFKITCPSVDISIDKVFNPKNKVSTILRRLHIFHANVSAFKHIPKDMLTRKLFKEWIMTYAYSQGRKARGEAIKEAFKDYYVDRGYKAVPFTPEILDSIVITLLDFFEHYSIKYLGAMKKFLDVVIAFVQHKLQDKKNKIIIKLKYCTWTLRYHEIEKTRHTFIVDHIPRKFTLYHHLFKKTGDVASKVPSILIQGIEAHFVHELYYKNNKINTLLDNAFLPMFFISTNHDCLGVNYLYCPLLVPLVQQSYNTISELKFPFLDASLKRKYLTVKCTNPNFIRF